MGSAFIKAEIVFRNFVPRRLFVTWGFPALCFDLLTDATQTCQVVSRLPVHYSRMMNSENAPKEIVQSFIDLVNMAKMADG